MKNETLYSESQKFKQWWLWLILLTINGLFLIAVYRQIVDGQNVGKTQMSDSGLLTTTVLIVLLTLLFAFLRLETNIKTDGVYVRFFPFHISYKHYPWEMLKRCFVRKYSPLTEYGGWGLRFGLFGKGTAFNVSGNRGLQLEFLDNKRLLIGTNKPQELTELLNKIGQLK